MLTALLGVVACMPDEPRRDIPPITWSGAQLDYAPQPGAYELCDGTLPYMDRYVVLAANAMGVEVDRPLVYVHGSDEDESFCESPGFLGCAFDDSVYAKVAPQEHEIVHGVRGWYGFSHAFFEEGTAEVFGDDAPLEMRVPSNGDLLKGIWAASGETGLPTSWYPRAGHFVAHLHDRYGPEVTAALLQETNAYSSPARAIEVIEDATSVPWEDLQEEYEAEPECDQAQYRYPLYGCEEPTALRARCDGDQTVWITERIACDDPTTLGPRDGEIWKTIAVEIPEDGEYLFFSYVEEGAAVASITIEECSVGCDSIVLEEPMGLVLPLERVFLRAGRYALRLTRPVEAPATVDLKISGPDCE